MPSLTEIKGVSESRAEDLREEDFVTVDDVATADPGDLTDVSGIGSATAPDLIEEAQNVITDSTLDQSEEEEEDDSVDNTVPDLEEGPEEDEEVTEEDLEQLLEEDEGEPDSVPDLEDDDGEPEEVDVGPETYELTLTLYDEDMYDYFAYAITDMKVGTVRVSNTQEALAENILGELRTLGGVGELTLSLTEDELNTLNASLTRSATAYKRHGIDVHNDIIDVKEQVSEVREHFR